MCLMLAVSAVEPTTLELWGARALMLLGVAGGLTFVIFVHELGHFLVAKACGVKCEKFYIGFDFLEISIPFTKWKLPRSLCKFQWGETEYGIGSLPLGGYVKMLGQDDDPRNAEAEAARTKVVAEGTAAEGLKPGETIENKPTVLDPRSFPAKSVPARMAIISAGVIMNLIFAVLMATLAFKLGVKEIPAVIGATTPGGAAWVEGLEPGSKLIQIGERGKPYEFLSFNNFRATAMLNNGRAVKVLMRHPDGKEVWHELTPTTRPGAKAPMIGIGQPEDLELNIWPGALSYRNPKSSVPLLERDAVVEIAGQKVASGPEADAVLAQQPLGPIVLKVERKERKPSGELVKDSKQTPQIIEVTLEPRPMRELGLTMKIGPIVAIRNDSPAKDAGFLKDDVIVEVAGEPVGDPLSLSQRLTPQINKATSSSPTPIQVVVERKVKGQITKKTLEVTPELPLQSPTRMGLNPTSIESIGVAFSVLNEVASVDAAGPAKAAGLQPGDVVTKVTFIAGGTPEENQKLEKLVGKVFDSVELSETKGSWPGVSSTLQMLPPSTKVELTWKRGDKVMTGKLDSRESTTFFDDSRGLTLYGLTKIHIATDWGDAFRMGFREAFERVKEVGLILQSLLTGRISPTNLSGPPGILMAAASFASEGFSSLLIFLTILSANLAVLNFLPIPVLDGGHMIFLAAEGIRGKPVSGNLQYGLTIAGLVCLLTLMIFATAMDIGRFAEMIRAWF